ncbi:hypothetical protein BDY19DRAFT_994011 [Irpex rosettiformis]|uniref:Uncharacterized protein n=1 Tax=Irpex rosettiformis TaxID=378272 RepID=A0ACB8U2P5_9APHY|nr:hypothetical protein BDY19DRAFT_994011 [Irpex rosettiformis]
MSPQSALELAVGPLLVLICVACILFGVFSAQVFFYWSTYDKDGPKLKAFVCFIWILEALHTAFCIHVMYFYFVTHFGDPVHGVNTIVWSCGITVILEVVIVSLTEGFYVRRIWHLAGKKSWVVAGPTLLLIVRAFFSLYTVSFLYKYETWANYREHQTAQSFLWTAFSLGLVADFSITSLLIGLLRKKRTKFAATNMKVAKLMHYTINTGALTLIVSAAVIGTIGVKNSLLFGGMIEVVSKLYANSMLAMLNARKHITLLGEGDMSEFVMSTRGSSNRHTTGIKIVTETSIARDMDEQLSNPTNAKDSFQDYNVYDGSTQKVQSDALTRV